MLKRDFKQLSVFSVNENTEEVLFESLKNLYMNQTSEVIYVVKDQKLSGIVCIGEILKSKDHQKIAVNKNFTFLVGFDMIEAYKVFKEKKRINHIPVVDKEGNLLGDYSRWDDMLFIQRNHKRVMDKKAVTEILKPYEAVYVVEPIDNRQPCYLQLLEYLRKFEIGYVILKKDKLEDQLLKNVICIFLNEDERRGVQCLYRICPYLFDSRGYDVRRYDMINDKHYKLRLATYKSLLLQIIEETCLKRLNIVRPERLSIERIDEKAVVFLSALQKKGVKCFALHKWELESSEYIINFQNEMEMIAEIFQKEPHISTKQADFYDDLYQQDDYRKGIAQKEIEYGANVFERNRNVKGKYFNAKDGRRHTCFQPKSYVGTIYLMGPCSIIGALVEDQYTVASYLQKKLLEKGYFYKVENYGSMIRTDAELDTRLMEIGQFSKNDILIFLSGIGEIVGIPGDNFEKMFERHKIPAKWVRDGHTHCNHKVTNIMADDILKMIESKLLKETFEDEYTNNMITANVDHIMKYYIEQKYLKEYFINSSCLNFHTVGAVVMNCDLFHVGHRYFIEQAKSQVDFLVIFLMEDVAQSVYSFHLIPFEERFRLLKKGICDINNVMIVPNGEFVLSTNNFQQYYTQHFDMSVEKNARYDIEIFSDYIAKSLHITHRFAGKDPKGRIKKAYNKVMKELLPQKGITFVEIPRYVLNNQVVSTSQIKEYIEEKKYDKAFSFLTETTKQYLMYQLNLPESN